MARTGWVIITETDPIARKSLAHAVRRAGHEVIECESGLQTLLEVAKWPPDVVVLDDSISDLGLGAVVDAIRSRPDGSSVGIIALLHDRGDGRIHSFEGVDVCIRKPVRASSLVAAVRDLIEPEPEPMREVVPVS
ncbi:MAG: hypothetical protein KatS3mg008_1787 [Acidimicrobiales bacterium]|nr:MAG: hypothetical protein KatS3mg008_1787 [Acidimicrobiales bacterium]